MFHIPDWFSVSLLDVEMLDHKDKGTMIVTIRRGGTSQNTVVLKEKKKDFTPQ
jgi:hypothetical protein